MTAQLEVAHCEQFIHSARGKKGYKIIASPNIRDLADNSLLQSILTEPANMKEPCYRQVVFHDEGVVAASYFQREKDGWNRWTTFNHTILIREDDYRALGSLPVAFKFQSEPVDILGPLDVVSNTFNPADFLGILNDRFHDKLGNIFRAIATHNLDRRSCAEIGIRVNSEERIILVNTILGVIPPSLRLVSWTTEGMMPTPWSYGVAIRENWRTTVTTPENMGFKDLANLGDNLPSMKLLHERYAKLFGDLRPYEWNIYNRVLNQLLNGSKTPLGELYRVRADRRDLVRRKIIEEFKAKLN